MFEDVPVLLHAQDQATAPIGQEIVHVNVCSELRSLSSHGALVLRSVCSTTPVCAAIRGSGNAMFIFIKVFTLRTTPPEIWLWRWVSVSATGAYMRCSANDGNSGCKCGRRSRPRGSDARWLKRTTVCSHMTAQRSLHHRAVNRSCRLHTLHVPGLFQRYCQPSCRSTIIPPELKIRIKRKNTCSFSF